VKGKDVPRREVKKKSKKAPIHRSGKVGRPIEVEIHGGHAIPETGKPRILGHPIPEPGKVEIHTGRKP
jgi:hypothetical protein